MMKTDKIMKIGHNFNVQQRFRKLDNTIKIKQTDIG